MAVSTAWTRKELTKDEHCILRVLCHNAYKAARRNYVLRRPHAPRAVVFFMSRRAHMFIDGFNLYHIVMDDPYLRAYRWLDFRKLGQSLTSRMETLSRICYFNAFYPGDQAKRARHQTFIDAQKLHGVDTVLGAFRKKDKLCGHRKKTLPGCEEKETDVNIVTHLFQTVINGEFDKAMILSGDSDLAPAAGAFQPCQEARVFHRG